MSRNYFLAVVAVCVVLSRVVTLSAQTGYALTELGSVVQPVAINNSGQIAGSCNQAAFLYSGGTWENLGTLGGADNSHTYAAGINDEGQVVGGSLTSTGVINPFLYAGGTMTALPNLPAPYVCDGGANRINGSGEIVGDYFDSSGTQRLPLYERHDAGPRHFSRRNQRRCRGDQQQRSGSGLRDRDRLLPRGRDQLHPRLPLQQRDDGGPRHAARPYNYGSQADAINNNGQVVGFSYGTAGAKRAFLYSNGTMEDLGMFGTPYAINDSGQVVGTTLTSAGAEIGFLYSNGTTLTFNSLVAFSGWSEEGAGTINDEGWMAGGGFVNGHYEGFLLTPVTGTPEPPTLAPALTALLCATAFAWRRRRAAECTLRSAQQRAPGARRQEPDLCFIAAPALA